MATMFVVHEHLVVGLLATVDLMTDGEQFGSGGDRLQFLARGRILVPQHVANALFQRVHQAGFGAAGHW